MTFQLSDLVCPRNVLSKFSHIFKILFGCCHPMPWKVSPGAVRSPALLVTPLGASLEMWNGTVPPKTINLTGFYLLLLE